MTKTTQKQTCDYALGTIQVQIDRGAVRYEIIAREVPGGYRLLSLDPEDGEEQEQESGVQPSVNAAEQAARELYGREGSHPWYPEYRERV